MGDHSLPEDGEARPGHDGGRSGETPPRSRPRPSPAAQPDVNTQQPPPTQSSRDSSPSGGRPARHAEPAQHGDAWQPVDGAIPEPGSAFSSALREQQPGPIGDFDLGDPPLSAPDLIERTADFALAKTLNLLTVLDVGCGNGLLLGEIAMRVPYCKRYIGVDPNLSVLDEARRRRDPRIEYLHAEAAELPCADASIDLVLALRSLGLLRDPAAGLREMRRVLRPNGRIVVVERTGRSPGRKRPLDRRWLSDAAEPLGLRLTGSEVVARTRLGFPSVRGFLLNL